MIAYNVTDMGIWPWIKQTTTLVELRILGVGDRSQTNKYMFDGDKCYGEKQGRARWQRKWWAVGGCYWEKVISVDPFARVMFELNPAWYEEGNSMISGRKVLSAKGRVSVKPWEMKHACLACLNSCKTTSQAEAGAGSPNENKEARIRWEMGIMMESMFPSENSAGDCFSTGQGQLRTASVYHRTQPSSF